MNEPAQIEAANDQTEAYFEIYRVHQMQLTKLLWAGGEWRWRFCSPGGKTIAASAGYDTSDKCLDAVHALQGGAGRSRIHQLP